MILLGRALSVALTVMVVSCTSIRVPIDVPPRDPPSNAAPSPAPQPAVVPDTETTRSAEESTTDEPPASPVEPRATEPSGDMASPALSPPSVDRTLDERVRSIIDVPPYHQTHWGIIARDLHDGTVLYELNSHKTFIPGSAMKVLVTAGALAELGPDYRYSTALWATGPIRQGRVEGDLVLDGRGDPTLSGRFRASGEAALDELADLVVRSGVQSVRGALVIDVSRWDSTAVPGSWMGEDLGWAWGASGGAFVISEGEISATVYGGSAAGEPATVEWNPSLGRDRQTHDVTTWALDSTALRPDYRDESRQVVLGGTIGVNMRERESLAARDPVRIAGELLLRALERRDVDVDRGVTFRWTPGEDMSGCSSGTIETCSTATRVARLESPPLMEIVRALMQPSQNWVTEQLLRTLGSERGSWGSWEEGLGVLERVLVEDFSVLSADVDLYDGSGMSAYNLVTPRSVSDVLTRVRVFEWGDDYRNTLAAPGDRGTLAYRLGGLEGRVFAKTGTLKHTNSLSGYLIRDGGQEMVFSILTNNSGLETRDMRDVIDRLVVELSSW